MDEKFLKKQKKKLEEMREEMLKIVSGEEEKNTTHDVQDEIDQATEIIEELMGSSLTDNYRENLKLISDSLKRIDEGHYGSCQRCGLEIPQKRLEAQPVSLYCVQCKSQIEQSGEN